MNNTGNFAEFGQAWWAEARKKVKKAFVFIDPVSCESLHWNGGAGSLLDAGAIGIKELSTFEVAGFYCYICKSLLYTFIVIIF